MAGKTKAAKRSRLASEMLETAQEMHDLGIMDDDGLAKITMRQVDRMDAAKVAPLSGADIRALREQARMSQAVFARYLHLTVGHVSKLERGAERPTGPALVLLDVIRRLGIQAIL